MRYLLWASVFCFGIFAAFAMAGPAGAQFYPPTYVPSGETMYKQFCAACHGADAKGDGPAAATLKTHPPDLTLLTRRFATRFRDDPSAGKFPYQYVANILMFGPGTAAHGSADMPTWGPIFQLMDKDDQQALRERIRKLSDYLASLQQP